MQVKYLFFSFPACGNLTAFTTLSRQYLLSNVLFENLKELKVLLGITQKVNLKIELLLIREMYNQTNPLG